MKCNALPREAQARIDALLSKRFRIGTDELEAILKECDVAGDPEALQKSYRKAVAQRYMASIRDEDGKREILAVYNPDATDTEYVVLDACNDRDQLGSLLRRLEHQKTGLNNSALKVRRRKRFLDKFFHRRKRA